MKKTEEIIKKLNKKLDDKFHEVAMFHAQLPIHSSLGALKQDVKKEITSIITDIQREERQRIEIRVRKTLKSITKQPFQSIEPLVKERHYAFVRAYKRVLGYIYPKSELQSPAKEEEQG